LLIEDDPKGAEVVFRNPAIDGIEAEITRVETEADFSASLEPGDFDLILGHSALRAD
jgi:hypothetical protein